MSSAKCGLRISAIRRAGSRMNSVTSCVRVGLYVATAHSSSVIAPSQVSTDGVPNRSRSGWRTTSSTCIG